jgi:polysaccharide biosynthesis transport protein
MDSAVAAGAPFSPNLASNILKGIGAGLFLGVFLVAGLDRINTSLRAPGESSFFLGVPELGVIPAESMRTEGFVDRRSLRMPQLLTAGDSKPSEKVELITLQDGSSVAAESFRSTLASILRSNPHGKRPQVLLITSASKGEGKSTTVSNLAIALAEIGRKVLLIDGDLRKPRLHELFDVSNSWGLSDVLRGEGDLQSSPLDALVRKTSIDNLCLLPSGPGTLNIANLLYSPRTHQLVAKLRRNFDTILIDTPPMMTISDARVLGQLADAAILVIRAGETTRDAAMTAKLRLMEDGIPVLGTILNRWNRKAKTRYGYYGHGYHQSNA